MLMLINLCCFIVNYMILHRECICYTSSQQHLLIINHFHTSYLISVKL